ncbi:hypothetical protein [Pseudarthrobacter sp. BIM B-2242]|uniref:hypothetical protein n=1 Tax=Pseudarthrobacter sp. BIM B-2242 TaxID=2772401 RepID=UPI00168B03B3|nr:hypothetical protein [Pseudarthrobacter sp. BIM B-2242]QOD03252.1 hypothetical protein IDT60_18450 [Pseudarthrobacter sp. BIM B-2242]
MSDTAGPRDDRTVDSLLRDAGFDDDAVLRDALQDLRGLAGGQPEPSAAVAALMVPAGGQSADRAATRQLAAVPATRHLAAVPATRHLAAVPAPAVEAEETAATPSATPPTDELAARRRTKRRITLTTLSVAVSLAAGGAVAVASDQGIRDSIGQVNQAVSSFVAGVGGGSAPAPPVDSPVPLPARPGAPATVPPAPPVPEPVPAAPGSGSSQLPQQAPDHPGKAGQPGSAPAVPLPDLPVPDTLAPGLPGVPDTPPNREGQPPALPLPSAPPVPLPGIQQ